MYCPGELLKLPSLGEFKQRWVQVTGGIPTLVTVRKNASGWYFLAFKVEEDVQALPEKPNRIGVDIGLKDLAFTIERGRIGNPRTQWHPGHAQRALSQAKKRSGNWEPRPRRKVPTCTLGCRTCASICCTSPAPNWSKTPG